MIQRRHLLRAGALAPLVVLAGELNGCALGAAVTGAGQDITAVLAGLKTLVQGLNNLLPANVATQVQTWLTEVESLAGGLLNPSPTTPAAPSQFISVIEQILGVVAALPVIPPPFNLVSGAIAALLPTIAGWFNLNPPTVSAHLRAAAPHGALPWPAMTVGQARHILHDLAH